MGRKVTIEVTDDDISEGVPLLMYSCPIALAAKRINLAKVVSVGGHFAYVVSVGGHFVYVRNGYSSYPAIVMLPIEAIDFISAFDSNQPVEPFSFEIEVPDVIE